MTTFVLTEKKQHVALKPQSRAHLSIGGSPYPGAHRQLDDGVTPISKSTKSGKHRSEFNFEKYKKSEDDMFSSGSTNLIDFILLPHTDIGKGDSSHRPQVFMIFTCAITGH